MLCRGIATGAKHSVPLANILLSFIMLSAVEEDPAFMSQLKLWVRYIDDCNGIFMGTIQEFKAWFQKLQVIFRRYSLELTCDTHSHYCVERDFIPKVEEGVTFLDMDIFLSNNTIHTKEHRKDTSAVSYLPIHSAHARHTFSGIIKSQCCRLRRICSRQEDFEAALVDLKERCLRSGYDERMVQDIIDDRRIERVLLQENFATESVHQKEKVKLIVLAGTHYEKLFHEFANKVNRTPHAQIKVDIVKTTGPTIGQLLFNNSNRNCEGIDSCHLRSCVVCPNDIRDDSGVVYSTTNHQHFRLGRELNCNEGGIYVVSGACSEQYSGKTVHFGPRMKEHLKTQKSSTVNKHMKNCDKCNEIKDFKITYVESYHDRGKYTLSEREYLWNHRIQGSMNIQKTLTS